MTIKEARLDAGMTVKELSELLGIPKRTLFAWEAGTRIPPDYVEKMIVEKLHIMNITEKRVNMENKTEKIHEVYVQCKEVFEPSLELQDEFFNIQDEEERMFYELLANFFMQQRQKQLVRDGVY